MNTGGVFGVARKIWDDPDFKDEPYTERQAFIWLIGAAAWKETKVSWKNGRCSGSVTVGRGEFCFAERFLAAKWQWDSSRVRRFLKKLERHGILQGANHYRSEAQTKAHIRVYSISNYAKYQIVGLPRSSTNDAQSAAQSEAKTKNRKRKGETSVSPNDDTPTVTKIAIDEAFNAYNVVASELELPRAEKLTGDRRRKLAARLKEHGLEGWKVALENLRSAEYLIGFAKSGFRANLDFLLRPEKLNPLIEGAYATRRSQSRSKMDVTMELIARADEREKTGQPHRFDDLFRERENAELKEHPIIDITPKPT